MTRITTSEPAYRAPVSQSQRDRMGQVHPMTRPGTWTDALAATGVFGAFVAMVYGVAMVWSS